MSIVGNWTLHYSWGCTASYTQIAITFNANGTFSTGVSTGKWVQQDGTILLSYDNGPAKYGGTVNGNVASGAMTWFAGNNGCWYLTKQGLAGITAEVKETAGSQLYDAAGNKV